MVFIQKIRNSPLPLDVQIDLFDKTIKPVLLYGFKVWGVGNVEVIERVQLKLYKQSLNLKKATLSYTIMVNLV